MINVEALKNVLSMYALWFALVTLLAGAAAVLAAMAYDEAKKTRRAVEDWFLKWEERTRVK